MLQRHTRCIIIIYYSKIKLFDDNPGTWSHNYFFFLSIKKFAMTFIRFLAYAIIIVIIVVIIYILRKIHGCARVPT